MSAPKMIDLTGSQYVPVGITMVTDSTGQYAFDPNSLPQAYTYDANGNVSTITVTALDSNQYKQTFTYDVTTGKLSNVSAWVKQ
jgi:YD repeat-containing protein